MESLPSSPELFMDRIERDLVRLPPSYRELWDFVVPLAGSRTPEIILPLAAVSLCYERPDIALPTVLERLLQSDEGQEFAMGEKLFNAPFRIKGAGHRLGSAQKQNRWNRRFKAYATFFRAYRSAGVSLYEILANPRSLNRMPDFPLCISFTDSFLAKGMSTEEGAGRIALAWHLLEGTSLPRFQSAFERDVVSYTRHIIER
jgi:hypothetical protein